MSRATFLRSAATESSRSRIRPSGPEEGPLASLRSESPGTNRKERIGLAFRSAFGAFAHQRLALAFGHDFAALVGGGVAEFDDAGIGPRPAFARAQHRRSYLERVAMDHRLGEAHVGHAEIGAGGAGRGGVHRDPDRQG